MRSDASANRELLLDAASDVFAELGIGAPLYAVARRAGVGNATLYRNFPDRHALIMALAARTWERYAAVVSAAQAAESGWRAIEISVDGVMAMFLDYPWLPAVRDYARESRDDDPDFERVGREIIERAQAEGALRRDIDATDVAFVPSLLAGLLDLPEPVRSIVIARQRDIILDGLRAEGVPRRPPGGTPLDTASFRALVRPGEAGAATSEREDHSL